MFMLVIRAFRLMFTESQLKEIKAKYDDIEKAYSDEEKEWNVRIGKLNRLLE